MRIAVEADTRGFDRAMGDLQLRAGALGSAFTSAFRNASGGGKSLEGVLKQLATRISGIALDSALRPVGTLAGNLLNGLIGSLGGALGGGAAGAAAPQRVVPFAKGGVVRAPSFFPMGGAAGLMGEAGAEAILPLRRGSDGSLGVATSGGGARGGPTTVVFNVSTPDAPSFRRAEGQIQAMLARAALRGQRGL
ncbi:phage tail tape measure protein [Aureimonas sp. AU4]|uniref:phage tail tape measure protein n=1 Tax=Aureimonas sp. AU4 TaxID=1638163 RepID=UPI0012E3CA01|nr:phage tail tape measure protein [Aureimonas sp. AU4]